MHWSHSDHPPSLKKIIAILKSHPEWKPSLKPQPKEIEMDFGHECNPNWSVLLIVLIDYWKQCDSGARIDAITKGINSYWVNLDDEVSCMAPRCHDYNFQQKIF